jgi:SAM-dependent methyltransferase
MSNELEGLRLDLGCGRRKKEGTLGIDIEPLPDVDYVLDLESEPLPFNDQSVAYVFSSNFLEHLEDPGRLFEEISRVCVDGAWLELVTPYGGSNPGFVLGHKTFFTEDIYLHICVWYTDHWVERLGVRWILDELQYVIKPDVLCYLKRQRIGLDFAIKHLRNIVAEFWAYVTVRRHDLHVPAPPFRRTFSTWRFGPRYEIKHTEAFDETQSNVEKAIRSFARGGPLLPI